MPRIKQKYRLGSYAPKLTKEQVAELRQLAEDAPLRAKEYINDLCRMLETFWETGMSTVDPITTDGGVKVVPLEQAEINRIWDYVPYLDECDTIGRVFNDLPSGTRVVIDTTVPKGQRVEVVDEAAAKLRNGAYHLLWYARELALDREPVTKDTLPADL